MAQQDRFISIVQNIVEKLLDKMGFFVSEWHMGKVESINTNGTLNVYIDASTTVTPSIPANPDVTFSVNDEVWVHFINRKPNNLFIPYKRQIIA